MADLRKPRFSLEIWGFSIFGSQPYLSMER
jgi:hypothetical protein